MKLFPKAPRALAARAHIVAAAFAAFAAAAAGSGPRGAENPDCGQDIEARVNSVSVSDNTITIGGVTVAINGLTKLEDDDNNTLTLGDFTPGDFAETEGCYQPDGSYLAAKVEKRMQDPDDDSDCESKIEGPVTVADPAAGSWVIAGVTVTAGPGVEYEDAAGNPVAATAFTVGIFAEAEGCYQPDGSLLAREIELSDGTPGGGGSTPPSNRCEQEFSGVVNSANETSGTLVLGGRTVATDSRTAFLDDNNQPTTFAAFQPGVFAEAEGCIQGDGSLLARKVKLDDDADPAGTGCGFEHEGAIGAIDGGARTMTIRGMLVRTTAGTEFRSRAGAPIAFEDFAAGDYAEAEGCVADDGSLAAREVKLRAEDFSDDPGDDDAAGCGQELRGIAAAIDGASMSFELNGVVVFATAGTEIKEDGGAPLAFSALANGDGLKAEGCIRPDGSLLAGEIERQFSVGQTPPPGFGEDFEVFGIIESVNLVDRRIVVEGVTFQADDTTVILSTRNTPIEFADLGAGQAVEAKGFPTATAGVFAATRIKLEDENTGGGETTTQVATGVVEANTGSTLTVGGTEYAITGTTRFKSFGNAPAVVGDFVAGSIAKVEAVPAAAGSPIAVEVEMEGGVIGAIDGTARTFTAGGVVIAVGSGTSLEELNGAPLAFGDFFIGDLIDPSGTFAAGVLNAGSVTRIGSVGISGAITGFNAVADASNNGIPAIRADQLGTFGFMELPLSSLRRRPSTLYELTARLSTDLGNKAVAPVIRVRANMDHFQRGLEFVITSTADGRFSPDIAGAEYKAYFAPTLPPSIPGQSPDWFATIDLLSTLPEDAAIATVRFEGFEATPIPMSRVRVARTLLDEAFSRPDHGWTFGAAPEFFPAPASGYDPVGGALSLTPNDESAFGYWERQTGIPVEGGKLYRARMYVRSDAANKAAVPTFRVRVNLASFQLGAVTVIESTGNGDESPTAEARLYDAYLRVPGTPVDSDSLLLAFDVLKSQLDDALGTTLYLDRVRVEELVIVP
ncbi:MAG: DUF5666 domain-containing protein [Candidatus Sumerlaeia bacterium]|nr:DUF5666 domain-containing protein [Candidatus Sumerlaeia bacterium]